jgi:hypothetical protein
MENIPNPEYEQHMLARKLILGAISVEEAFNLEQDAIERSLGERPELPDFHD